MPSTCRIGQLLRGFLTHTDLIRWSDTSQSTFKNILQLICFRTFLPVYHKSRLSKKKKKRKREREKDGKSFPGVASLWMFLHKKLKKRGGDTGFFMILMSKAAHHSTNSEAKRIWKRKGVENWRVFYNARPQFILSHTSVLLTFTSKPYNEKTYSKQSFFQNHDVQIWPTYYIVIESVRLIWENFDMSTLLYTVLFYSY